MRGRVIAAPPGKDIRPTSDKVRQAIFNILLKYGLPENARVLDICCGTGVLGLEALSRGASFAIFADKSRESLAACNKNIAMLGVENSTQVLQRDAVKPGAPPAGREAATLLFIDPPYRHGILPPALEALAQGWLAPGAICVAECESGGPAPAIPAAYEELDARVYGASRLLFLRFSGV
jgi:16S rRNA (guanine966-N2)-methyltransferase